jgi:hypothetical protein
MGKTYDPNAPFWMAQSLGRAEQAVLRAQRKLEELQLRKAINDIDVQLKLLGALKRGSPPSAA